MERPTIRWKTRITALRGRRLWAVSTADLAWALLEASDLGPRITFWWQVLQARWSDAEPAYFDFHGWKVRVDDE